MSVQKYLDAAISHISYEDSQLLHKANTDLIAPTRIIEHVYGYWVHIYSENSMDNINRIKQLLKYGFSPEFLTVYQYAINHKCNWINFDQDACEIDNLKTFSW